MSAIFRNSMPQATIPGKVDVNINGGSNGGTK